MATFRDIVKQWYITGAKPTQAQFWTLFDDIRFNDEALDVADIGGLTTILNATASQASVDAFTGGELIILNVNGTYNLPAGYLLEKMIIAPSVNMNIAIGKTLGGDEISIAQAITGGVGEVYEVNVFANAAPVTIYFSGITASTTITILKRKLKLA